MKAWQILSKKSKWTKDSYAKDADGKPVPYFDVKAVCWCASGAIMKAYKDTGNSISMRLELSRILKETGLGNNIAEWNDSRYTKYKQVFNLLKKNDI
jgi:hypothetical protein